MIRRQFLPVLKPDITQKEINGVIKTLKSGLLTTGPRVAEFESRAVTYLKEDTELYAVALNSCTAGLFLALKVLGIGPGDEVILPTWTFAATIQVVEWTGATPILCDIEEESLNLDVKKAARLVTSKTKAIIPVHFAGYPCDMEEITALARTYGLVVVEDAAHAFGTRYKGKKIGNFSDLTAFSFYATKNLTTGEGGMVVSRNRELIEKIRRKAYFGINRDALKRYGQKGTWRYDIEELGYKFNLDDIYAALGMVQLGRLDRMLSRKRQIAKLYRKGMKDLVHFTADSDEHFHTYHLFCIKLKDSGVERDALISELKKRNIGTSVHYIPLHMHSFYKSRFPIKSFECANKVFDKILSIPIFSSMTDRDVQYVITHITQLLSRR